MSELRLTEPSLIYTNMFQRWQINICAWMCVRVHVSVPIKVCSIWKLAHSFGGHQCAVATVHTNMTLYCQLYDHCWNDDDYSRCWCKLWSTHHHPIVTGHTHMWIDHTFCVCKCTIHKLTDTKEPSKVWDGWRWQWQQRQRYEGASKRQTNKDNLFQLTLSFNMHIAV